MEDTGHVIKDIVSRCAAAKVAISEVLAAFVLKTYIEADVVRCPLDRQLASTDIQRAIEATTERLTSQDDPALETIKMQVEFDSAYFEEETRLENYNSIRERRCKDMQRVIAQTRPRHGTDFDTINDVYKEIFKYILYRHCPDGNDPEVEREIAAAVESVFPRIGVRAFTQLTNAEKKQQLDELANVTLGIRLLNKAMHKGGVGIREIDNEVNLLLTELKDNISKETDFLQDLCLQYQETLVYTHMTHLRTSPSGELLATVDRLKDELANRRQFHTYLQGVHEDVLLSSRRCDGLLTKFNDEMNDLQGLVGGRTTVPKEQVYPKFNALASIWQGLEEELRILQARSRIYDRIQYFRGSFHPIFDSRLPLFKAAMEYQQTAAKQTVEQEEELAAAAANAYSVASKDGIEDSAAQDKAGDQDGSTAAATAADGAAAKPSIADEGKATPAGGSQVVDKPVKLSISATPEFMQLPLEYQGFCPWTILHRRGLLLPGKPALGVVRYKNAFYVFAHEVGLQYFMAHPEEILEGMRRKALENPELINLLRMTDAFPDSCSIRILLRGGRKAKSSNMPGLEVKEKRDMSTETPVHFTDKHIDYKYEWNEWQLRRKALQVANLRHCRTVSQQTDASHFRRENDSQVYPLKDNWTQTLQNQGTNPPRNFTYLAGLRHSSLEPQSNLHRPSQLIKGVSVSKAEDKPGVVQMTFEHKWDPPTKRK